MVINHIQNKKWGHEHWIVNSDLYCGKILYVETHWKISYHYHKIKHETFHILDGFLYFKFEGEEFILQRGNTIVIPQNCYHSFGGFSTYPVQILEISTKHMEEDSYREDVSHKVDHAEFTRWGTLPYFKQSQILKNQCEEKENVCVLSP